MNTKSISIILLVVIMFGGIWFAYKDKQKSQQSSVTQSQNTAEPTPDIVAVTTPVVNGGAILASEITLTITSPTNGATVTTATTVVRGKTKPNAEVFVNDEDTIADANGNFSVTLSLDDGENPIVVSANDADGNIAERELSVNYDSGQ